MGKLQGVLPVVLVAILLVLLGAVLSPFLFPALTGLDNTRLQATAAAAELEQLQATLEVARQQTAPFSENDQRVEVLMVIIIAFVFATIAALMIGLYWYFTRSQRFELDDLKRSNTYFSQEIQKLNAPAKGQDPLDKRR
jgi:predicted secreted protein